MATQPATDSGRAASLGWIAQGVAVGGAALALVCFAWLRETPIFWRNAGGFPVWLRTTVLWGFHPLLFGTFCGALWLSWALLARWRGSSRLWAVQAALILGTWLLLGLAILFAAANNVSNLIDGRPLHSHLDGSAP